MIAITRRSPWSNKIHTMELDLNYEDYKSWKGGMLIQDAMPRLNSSEREFIKTGLTPGDWIDMFKDDLEEEIV